MTGLATVDPAGELDRSVDPAAAVLALCERGSQALTEASTLDEGSHVLGFMSTLEHATKVRDLNAEAVVAASAMRVRAERRVGELIRVERDAGRLDSRGGDRKRHLRPINVDDPDVDPLPTLADHGISRDQAAEFQRLADTDEATFEAAVAAETTRAADQGGTGVTRAGVLRRINPDREASADERWLAADRFVTACRRLTERADAAETAIRFGVYPGDTDLVADAVDDALTTATAALGRVRAAWDRRTR